MRLLTHIKNESEVRKEELKIEREMVEHIAAVEKKLQESIDNFAQNINQTMRQGFMTMQNLFSQNMKPQMVEHIAAVEKKLQESIDNFAQNINQTMRQGFMTMQNLFSQNMQPQMVEHIAAAEKNFRNQ